MRFMILVKASADSEAGKMPSETLMAAMAAFHEELARAGVLLDANGLKPSREGWRIRHAGGRRSVVDGPFAETKELVAGYTLIQVPTREAALELTRRFPAPHEGQDCEIEVRPLFELEDFGSGEAADRLRALDAQAR